VDQEVFEELLQFRRLGLQVAEELLRVAEPQQRHASRHPPLDGAGLVPAEIDARPLEELPQDGPEGFGRKDLAEAGGRLRRGPAEPGRQDQQFLADLLGLQRAVGEAGRDGPGGEVAVGARRRIPDDGDAARGADRAEAFEAVGAGLREQDRDRAVARVGGQRREEAVHGARVPRARPFGMQLEDPVLEEREGPGRDHADAARDGGVVGGGRRRR